MNLIAIRSLHWCRVFYTYGTIRRRSLDNLFLRSNVGGLTKLNNPICPLTAARHMRSRPERRCAGVGKPVKGSWQGFLSPVCLAPGTAHLPSTQSWVTQTNWFWRQCRDLTITIHHPHPPKYGYLKLSTICFAFLHQFNLLEARKKAHPVICIILILVTCY